MVSRGDLGISYILAVGVGLLGALLSGVLVPLGADRGAIDSTAVLALVAGLTVSGGFTVSGIALLRSDLDGDRVWRVAKWSTLGLGAPTVAVLVLVLFTREPLQQFGWRSVSIIIITTGGLVGILVGAINELRTERDRTMALNQRNTVFLRLFRHDIRNSANVIRGHVDHLLGSDSPPPASVEAVQDHVDHIVRLSNAARKIERLDSIEELRPADLTAIVEARVRAFEQQGDDATLTVDAPDRVLVRGNDLLDSVVDNLLRNAIEHAGEEPTVHVSVEPGEPATLTVRDDGPGFSAEEIRVHSEATETQLEHSSGVGLWLVRWIVESVGGSYSLANAEEGGAVVTVELPAAERAAMGTAAG